MTASRRRWFGLAAAGVGCVVALAAGDAAARLFAPSWLVNRMRELEVSGRPDDARSDRTWPAVRGADGRFHHFQPLGHAVVATDEFHHDINFDEMGGRRTAPAGRPDAPVVGLTGDSFAFGVGVADDETFPSRLAPVVGVRFVNLALPGSALPQQLDLIERRHGAIGMPRVYVFCVYTGNDLDDIINTERQARAQPPLVTATPAADRARRINEWITSQAILRRSYLVQWTRAGVITLYNARKAVPLIDSAILPMTGNQAFWTEAKPSLQRALDRLVDAAMRLHFVPIVVLLPDRYQVDDAARSARIQAYGFKDSDIDPAAVNRVMTEYLRARSLAMIDLLGCLEGRQGLYFRRDMHLTPEGQRNVAACLESAGLGRLIRDALDR